MTEKSKKKTEILKPVRNQLTIVLISLAIIGAFIGGSLFSKTKWFKRDTQSPTSSDKIVPEVSSAPSRRATVDPVNDKDWIKGNKKARIALIEYSDLECPYCRAFHATAQQAVKEYNGTVMWVYRHFPLVSIHSKAPKEAEAIECAGKLAGNEGFWALTDKIFEVTPSNNGLDLDTLPDLAVDIGLNKNAFESCLNSGEMISNVNDDYQSGLKAGVTGTPGNFLLDTKTGKTQFLRGALPYAQLSQAINSMQAN